MKTKVNALISTLISTAVYGGVNMMNLPFTDPRYLHNQLQNDFQKAINLISAFEFKHIGRLFIIPLFVAFLLLVLFSPSIAR